MIFNNIEGAFFKKNFLFELGFNETEFSTIRDICVLLYKEFLDIPKLLVNKEMQLEDL